MYYTETWINGILHYKTAPNGKWRKVSVKELNRKLYELTEGK